MDMDDKEWQARRDADSLKEAEKIRGDRARLKAAKTELKKDLKAAAKAAGSKTRGRKRSATARSAGKKTGRGSKARKGAMPPGLARYWKARKKSRR